jgi:hypothetical protein
MIRKKRHGLKGKSAIWKGIFAGIGPKIAGIVEKTEGTAAKIAGTAGRMCKTAKKIGGTAARINGIAVKIDGSAEKMVASSKETGAITEAMCPAVEVEPVFAKRFRLRSGELRRDKMLRQARRR